jgi:hypothetical protein
MMPPTVEVLPRDVYNAELIAQVHPPDWRPPTPAPRYNLVVIRRLLCRAGREERPPPRFPRRS